MSKPRASKAKAAPAASTTARKRQSKDAEPLEAASSSESEELYKPAVKKSKHASTRKEWSELYDVNIFNKKQGLPDLVADRFMEFGAGLLDRSTVLHVIETIRADYHGNNYHNFEHACHVLLNCAFMLKHVIPELSSLEQLSLLYAALIHDVGHLGVPNLTLIQNSHPLAAKFHDQSVAEMNSLTVGLEVLSKPGHDILSHLNHEERQTFRKNVIDIVLATDVADTYKKRVTYLKLEDLSDEDVGLNTSHPACRLALLCIIMRACDVASSMQSVDTSEIWARNFFLEVSLASYDTEEILREESKKYFNNQIIYMEGHSLILVVKLQTTNAIRPEFTDILLQNFQSNLSSWREHGLDLLDSWTAEAVRNMQKNKNKSKVRRT